MSGILIFHECWNVSSLESGLTMAFYAIAQSSAEEFYYSTRPSKREPKQNGAKCMVAWMQIIALVEQADDLVCATVGANRVHRNLLPRGGFT
ncbi:hypothetical protein D918_00650 [Trichuris suis]|nr:hypothetical protein D918_00650 [Trichuris suis]